MSNESALEPHANARAPGSSRLSSRPRWLKGKSHWWCIPVTETAVAINLNSKNLGRMPLRLTAGTGGKHASQPAGNDRASRYQPGNRVAEHSIDEHQGIITLVHFLCVLRDAKVMAARSSRSACTKSCPGPNDQSHRSLSIAHNVHQRSSLGARRSTRRSRDSGCCCPAQGCEASEVSSRGCSSHSVVWCPRNDPKRCLAFKIRLRRYALKLGPPEQSRRWCRGRPSAGISQATLRDLQEIVQALARSSPETFQWIRDSRPPGDQETGAPVASPS